MPALIPFNRRRPDIMSTGFSDFQNMLDDFFTEAWPTRRNLAGDTFKIDVRDNGGTMLLRRSSPASRRMR
ncbi:MAG: hypothetical protein LBK67_04055 [Coriobacteriales bacterium]|nr:hypothetical protein [Coriobacteriales bacterium]